MKGGKPTGDLRFSVGFVGDACEASGAARSALR
jgi:hypothetical protein